MATLTFVDGNRVYAFAGDDATSLQDPALGHAWNSNPERGLYKSTDGGATWSDLNASTASGLPTKPWGRIAVTIAPSNSNVVYAFIEAAPPKNALYRSSDGGKTWEMRDRSQAMIWRPFYFANLIVDPKNENRIYKPDGPLVVSSDGGQSFSGISNGAHGDFHDLWIDPANTDHIITGDDGGMWYSFDAGNKWWKGDNLPISQFYHVSVDNDRPYHVYGGLQDNSSWVGDSEYPGGITNSRWENMYGGDGFWMFVDPTDQQYIYAEYQGGEISRINRKTHESRPIKPLPRYKEGKVRFNWNTPIHISPTRNGTVYIGCHDDALYGVKAFHGMSIMLENEKATTELRRALERDEITILYQPIVRLSDERGHEKRELRRGLGGQPVEQPRQPPRPPRRFVWSTS